MFTNFNDFNSIIFLFVFVSPILWASFIYIFFGISQFYNINLSIQSFCYILILVSFVSSLFLLINLNVNLVNFDFLLFINWFNFLNINYTIAIDSISLSFVLLTTFLFPICLAISWTSIQYKKRDFFLILFLTDFFILNFFAINDLFLFFLFFECILIPMYLLIGVWGSNLRKIYASYQLFFFTLFGSIFLLIAILIIHSFLGSLDYFIFHIQNNNYNLNFKLIIFLLMFISFSIKIPIVPFHFWLPEAHVEAPTSGSVILAGLLLKLGAFGLLKFILPSFSDIVLYLTPFLWSICCYSIIYVSFIILRQLDLKRIIAYSSIIHMNFILLGLFIFNKTCLIGGTFLLISHGVVSSALFICIGFLYERYHTRIVLYYKAIVILMPIFTILLFFFILANASLPGTSNFTGELLVFLGIFDYNKLVVVLLLFIGMFYSSILNFWVFNKISFGIINNTLIKYSNDLNSREFTILSLFLFFILLLGYFPNEFISIIKYKLLFLTIY